MKDFIMLASALQYIEDGTFDKIIYIRPNVMVKDVPDIGSVPGDEKTKLAWTLGPLFDKIGGAYAIDFLERSGKLETVYLGSIRGRSFENSIVYVSEGQNMTKEIVKLIISRVGENSELWMNADNHQTDKRTFDLDNGVTFMIDKLHGNPLFATVSLSKTERSKVAELASLLDELEEESKKM